MGGKNARNKFCRNTRIVRAKNVGIKSSEKSAKNFFLYSHEYRAEKMGGKKLAKQFFQKNSNNASKKCWEKIVGKKWEKRFFYIHTNIVTTKWGENDWKFFQKHTNSASKKFWGKNCRKKVQKNVCLYKREYRDQKMRGVKRAKPFFQKHSLVRTKKVGK